MILGYGAVIAIMTRKTAVLEKMKPKFGALYESLKPGNKFARFYPIWFMTKRIAFVFVVFTFKNTQGMVVTLIYIYLAEISAVLRL